MCVGGGGGGGGFKRLCLYAFQEAAFLLPECVHAFALNTSR